MDGLVGTQQAKWAAAALLVLGVAYLWRLNTVMSQTPPGAVRASPYRWADHEVRETYKRIKARPIDWTKHLPPRANRRYVVTGGSGGVGGQIVLHLLQRGEPAESIRIVDFRPVERADMKTGAAASVGFAQADITSAEATRAAFDRPWPPRAARLPLTVFHTAALIVPGERKMGTFERIRRVNVDGTQNVLDAARAAGASVFIATSSASVAHRPAGYWGNPFRRWPRNYFQAIDESDFGKPLVPHDQYFGNYAHTKAIAERLVCAANSPKFRTGAIRPANAIYGSSNADQVVGAVLRSKGTQSWMGNIVQNFVHGGHISLGHLQFEAALLRREMPGCAGKPFIITDDGPPPTYGDMYHLCELTAETPVKLTFLPPAPFLVLAHLVELVAAGSRTPVLRWLCPEPKGTLAILQPGVFHAGLNYVATDAAAQRSVEQGGLAFRHVHTTMEGMCQQVLEWNEEHAAPGS
ncbi:putative 3-beta hydroxysteroid dehydrogenase isomerase [Rosellinia necatrix]|uniref:Putative 3-beta hydroxysteroid dehydrogenase isomerase n=1 Tax=Rosellinia necatrix TaxID=77044 RepID=A0A1W2TGQ2_ROSNE|nr:putative 3-beta hydroxysteroid dehydrogenase isomerase [Rosellinia necatrix]